MQTLLILIGGATGAFARFSLGGWVQQRLGADFPWATLFVNTSGALVLGVVMRATERSAASGSWRALLAIGFCGAYTTFSTFGYETARLLQDRQYVLAGINGALNVLCTLLAMFAGFAIAARFLESVRA